MHNKISEKCKNISGIAMALSDFAVHSQAIGLTNLSESLFNYAKKLELAQSDIMKVVGNEISKQFKQSEERSKLVVEAAMAGIALGKSKKRKRTKQRGQRYNGRS